MPFNSIFNWIIRKRINQIEFFKEHPIETQLEVFHGLISKAANTDWGKRYDYQSIESVETFRKRVPLQTYDEIKPYVDRLIKNEKDLLWPGEIKWFAKSSGTTAGRSKFIPVSREAIDDCHYKGGKDLLSLHISNHPHAGLYGGKHLAVAGSSEVNEFSPDSYSGDLSAIIVKNLPFWAEIRRAPRKEIALMSNWENKIQAMAESTMKEDIRIIAGVPSWSLVLMNKILDISGAKYITDVWPNLELIMHGGVSFEPYQAQFEALTGSKKVSFVETYNASEGFFGIQDQPNVKELLLMLDYGIFYEFIPLESYKGIDSTEFVDLENVELDKNYVLVISTNAGLWRYIPGDTIKFTSKKPFRIKVSGRTKYFINTFGEELIAENAEEALAYACDECSAQISEYTAGPVFMDEKGQKGAHEWIIEFHVAPDNPEKFNTCLDMKLREVNSDYDAKRSFDFVLKTPIMHYVQNGTFYEWMKRRNKLGGQNKVPRLANHREYLDEILEIISVPTNSPATNG